MADAGLRDAETLGLSWGDVTLGERKGRVVVRLGKGAKRREVPLNAEVCRAVELWKQFSLLAQTVGGITGEPDIRDLAVFPGKGKGGRLATRSTERRMNELGELAKVERADGAQAAAHVREADGGPGRAADGGGEGFGTQPVGSYAALCHPWME